jgi:hypothetical protein
MKHRLFYKVKTCTGGAFCCHSSHQTETYNYPKFVAQFADLSRRDLEQHKKDKL